MKRPEQQLHQAVAMYLSMREKQGGFWWHHPANGGARTPAEGAIFKSLGVKAGTPDICLVKDGRAHWIELKAPIGRVQVSPAQEATMGRLREVGCPVAVCRSLDDVRAALTEWGIA